MLAHLKSCLEERVESFWFISNLHQTCVTISRESFGETLLKIFNISAFWNVGYFDRMGILAVSCFHRNLISLPLADCSVLAEIQFVSVIPRKENEKTKKQAKTKRRKKETHTQKQKKKERNT